MKDCCCNNQQIVTSSSKGKLNNQCCGKKSKKFIPLDCISRIKIQNLLREICQAESSEPCCCSSDRRPKIKKKKIKKKKPCICKNDPSMMSLHITVPRMTKSILFENNTEPPSIKTNKQKSYQDEEDYTEPSTSKIERKKKNQREENNTTIDIEPSTSKSQKSEKTQTEDIEEPSTSGTNREEKNQTEEETEEPPTSKIDRKKKSQTEEILCEDSDPKCLSLKVGDQTIIISIEKQCPEKNKRTFSLAKNSKEDVKEEEVTKSYHQDSSTELQDPPKAKKTQEEADDDQDEEMKKKMCECFEKFKADIKEDLRRFILCKTADGSKKPDGIEKKSVSLDAGNSHSLSHRGSDEKNINIDGLEPEIKENDRKIQSFSRDEHSNSLAGRIVCQNPKCPKKFGSISTQANIPKNNNRDQATSTLVYLCPYGKKRRNCRCVRKPKEQKVKCTCPKTKEKCCRCSANKKEDVDEETKDTASVNKSVDVDETGIKKEDVESEEEEDVDEDNYEVKQEEVEEVEDNQKEVEMNKRKTIETVENCLCCNCKDEENSSEEEEEDVDEASLEEEYSESDLSEEEEEEYETDKKPLLKSSEAKQNLRFVCSRQKKIEDCSCDDDATLERFMKDLESFCRSKYTEVNDFCRIFHRDKDCFRVSPMGSMMPGIFDEGLVLKKRSLVVRSKIGEIKLGNALKYRLPKRTSSKVSDRRLNRKRRRYRRRE